MPQILVSGSTGLIGKTLLPQLKAHGWTVTRMIRPNSSNRTPGDIVWDPDNRILDANHLENFDAMVHLAGESIADGRWTAAKKERIRKSRVDATQFLVSTLLQLKNPPKTFVSASAIGYYGDRGSDTVDETSTAGTSFLANVCRDWEKAAEPLSKIARIVFIRTGIILSPRGGALAKMLLPFKLGAGGKIGSGQQFMSWIDLDDEVGAIEHALKTETLRGPMNAVSPFPVTNYDFTKTLGHALSRPTIFPMLAFAARFVFGEMAEELLLSGARVMPNQLLNSSYVFKYPRLDLSLRHVIQTSNQVPAAPSPQGV